MGFQGSTEFMQNIFFSQIQGYHSWFFIFWPFWMLQELDWVVRQGRSAIYWRHLVFSVFYQGSRYIRNCHVKWPDNPLSGYPKMCVYPLHSLLCWKTIWKSHDIWYVSVFQGLCLFKFSGRELKWQHVLAMCTSTFPHMPVVHDREGPKMPHSPCSEF